MREYLLGCEEVSQDGKLVVFCCRGLLDPFGGMPVDDSLTELAAQR